MGLKEHSALRSSPNGPKHTRVSYPHGQWFADVWFDPAPPVAFGGSVCTRILLPPGWCLWIIISRATTAHLTTIKRVHLMTPPPVPRETKYKELKRNKRGTWELRDRRVQPFGIATRYDLQISCSRTPRLSYFKNCKSIFVRCRWLYDSVLVCIHSEP